MTTYARPSSGTRAAGQGPDGKYTSGPAFLAQMLRFRQGVTAWRGLRNGELLDYRRLDHMAPVEEQVHMELVRADGIRPGPLFDYVAGAVIAAIAFAFGQQLR